jgi:hypothetical protein
MKRYSCNQRQLQGLGPLTCSDFPVRRIDLTILLMVDLYLILIDGGYRISSEEFDTLAFVNYCVSQ